MISSRSLDDLHPRVAEKARAFLDACKAEGIDVLVTCTLRDWECQAKLYAQGRTTPGNRVTNATPGSSAHNYGLAFDVVPIRDGKPVWDAQTDADHALWYRLGEIGEGVGLEWAGRWKSFAEYAHFQDLGGQPIALLKAEFLADNPQFA